MIAPTRPGRPLILAHRGASAHAPANTLEAFLLAAELGADGIECDVRLTSDGHVVIHHDPIISGLGVVAASDLATVRRAHPEIPTLDEMLAVVPDRSFLLDIEIKNDPDEPGYDPTHSIAERLVDWIAAHGVARRVLVTSFNAATLAAVGSLDTTVATGLLLDQRQRWARALRHAVAAGHAWVLPHHSRLVVDPRRKIAAAHTVGLRIGTWTVDGERRMATLGRAEVDAVITNDPAVGRSLYP